VLTVLSTGLLVVLLLALGGFAGLTLWRQVR
jgi:hypothetical protein